MDPRNERLTRVMECHCREVIDHDHPLSVEVVGSPEHLVFEVAGEPGDESLILGGPCRQGTAPHDHTRCAAVWKVETPRQEAVTRVVLAADGSALAGEGVPHD
jgi:hypothetical protein